MCWRSLPSPRSVRCGQTALYFAAARQEGFDVMAAGLLSKAEQKQLSIIAGSIVDILVTWMITGAWMYWPG